MNSVKTKVIALVLSCILLTSFTIGGAGILNALRVVKNDSAQIMSMLCTNKAQEIDMILSQIQQSVKTLAVYAVRQVEDLARFQTDSAYVDEYSKSLLGVSINAAQNTRGAMAVYIRFNPEFTDPQSGLFCTYSKDDGNFRSITPTHITSFDPSDTSRVGWFYEPAKNKKGTWMAPYYNENIGVKMISYVVPVYINNVFLGVVGMDIDFTVLENIVSSTTVYDNGFAFLADQSGVILYHKELPPGTSLREMGDELSGLADKLSEKTMDDKLFLYSYQDEKRQASFQTLWNGMRFILTAPTREINAQAHLLFVQIVVSILGVIILASIFAFFFARRLVKPLLELNVAAKKIADGDLSISITHESKDEVGMLAESFRQTVNKLQKYISYINELAYRDPLTGVKNKTAYLEVVRRIEDQIRYKRPQFGIIVFDLNGLKVINDTRGHDFGDILISDSCKIICKTFKRSPVYRIGGDEFVVVLEDVDYQNYSTLLDAFEAEVAVHNEQPQNELRISIARGISLYSEETDLCYNDVFKRADSNMYLNKTEMKSHLQTQ